MKSHKTITVLAGNYPAKGHQALVFVQQLVHAIAELGYKVNVVAPQSIIHAIIHKKKILPRFSIGNSDSGVEYNIYRPISLSFGRIRFLLPLARWYNSMIVSKKIKFIKSDIVYAHFWSSAFLIHEYILKSKTPMFVACGEGDNALEEMVASLSEGKLKQLSSSVTGVISVSSENKRKCIEYGLAKEDNIGIFPNCVNTTHFHKIDVRDLKKQLGIEEDDFVICFVGSFTQRKGPDRVAQAIKKLNDSKIKVIFIGKPFPGYPYDFDCPGIIHKGPLDHNLLPYYLNCANIFVMPTQKEGCCNAIVEALAIGLPVISSDGAFNDDILDLNNSIRVNPNDVDAISNAILFLKNNPSVCLKMSEYSLSRHNEYSISDRASRILNFIDLKTLK